MKFWTLGQLPQIIQMEQDKFLPHEVVEEMEQILEILDTYYGKNRDVGEDDGGFILLKIGSEEEATAQYQEILEKWHLREGEEEYCDILQCRDGSEWQVMLFLATSEYGITVIQKTGGKGK